MKPIDKKDQYLSDAFHNEAFLSHVEEREIRENRRLWKKQRVKWVRNKSKKSIRQWDDDED
jgi:hypothetical protein